MLEEKKKYLRFTEANAWKGETWTVYTPLDDPSDLNLVENCSVTLIQVNMK